MTASQKKKKGGNSAGTQVCFSICMETGFDSITHNS